MLQCVSSVSGAPLIAGVRATLYDEEKSVLGQVVSDHNGRMWHATQHECSDIESGRCPYA